VKVQRGTALICCTCWRCTVACGRASYWGCKWDDVDLDAGKLSVRRTLSETRTGPKFEKPKNGKGRLVELSPTAIKLL